MTETKVYALDNDKATAPSMHDCLSKVLDPMTFPLLSGAGVRQGARCLDVGAGNGSVAAWMVDQVGDSGRVAAVDINARHIPRDRGIEIHECDVTEADLPPGEWDVINARLLLNHLPQRRRVLERMVEALAPGGALVVGSWGVHGQGVVLSAPLRDAARLTPVYTQYKNSLVAVFESRGNDPTWGVQQHQSFLSAGLDRVRTVGGAVESWAGGSAGCALPIAVSSELQDKLIEQGMTAGDLDFMRSRLALAETVVLADQMLFTVGRRPGSGAWV